MIDRRRIMSANDFTVELLYWSVAALLSWAHACRSIREGLLTLSRITARSIPSSSTGLYCNCLSLQLCRCNDHYPRLKIAHSSATFFVYLWRNVSYVAQQISINARSWQTCIVYNLHEVLHTGVSAVQRNITVHDFRLFKTVSR